MVICLDVQLKNFGTENYDLEVHQIKDASDIDRIFNNATFKRAST